MASAVQHGEHSLAHDLTAGADERPRDRCDQRDQVAGTSDHAANGAAIDWPADSHYVRRAAAEICLSF